MSDATLPRDRAALAGTLAVVSVLVLAATVGPVGAAGTTDVRLVPADDSIAVGDTTTVDVVVEDSQGGVGAFIARIGLEDRANVAVTDVTFHGEPFQSDVEVSDDGREVAIGAVILDTPDSGSVTVATLTVTAVEPGPAGFTLSVNPLADERGTVYGLGSVSGTSMTMEEGDGSGDGGGIPTEPIDDDDDDVLDIDLGQFVGDDDTTTATTATTSDTTETTTDATTDRTTEETEATSTTAEPTEATTQSTADGTTTTGEAPTSTTDDDAGSGLLAGLVFVAAILALVAAAFLALRRRS